MARLALGARRRINAVRCPKERADSVHSVRNIKGNSRLFIREQRFALAFESMRQEFQHPGLGLLLDIPSPLDLRDGLRLGKLISSIQ